MRTALHIIAMLLLLSGCYKDEIDLEGMKNNPFDRDYQGPAVIELVGTYVESTTIAGAPAQQQVIEFRVREELFLTPSPYALHVVEHGVNATYTLSPVTPGSDRFKYYRLGAITADPVCVDVALTNNGSFATPYTICASL